METLASATIMDDTAALVERARAGSKDAYCELVALYQAQLRGLLGRWLRRPELVDDVAQEVFLSAWRTLDRFEGRSSFRSWLFGIGRNKALEALRARRREAARDGAFEQAIALEAMARLEARIEDDEAQLDALRTCLEALPEGRRDLVQAFYFGGERAEDIARRSGRKAGAVRMTLLRTRQLLAQCIGRRLAGAEEQR